VAFNPADLTDLNAGGLYVNVHSTVHTGGEIRGQIVPGDAHLVPLTSGRQAVDRDFGNRNLPPVAGDDGYTVLENQMLMVVAPGVFANDSDPSGDAFTGAVVGGPTHGTLVAFDGATGAFTYQPNANYSGPDGFVYRITDTHGGTDEATVAVIVVPVNDRPVAEADTYTMAEDTVLTVAAPGVLANDTDADGDALSATLILQATNGDVALAPDGSFVYTPSPNFFGTDTFSYQATDGALASVVATVTITVTAVNDAPVAVADSATTFVDTPITFPVLANDTDAEGDPLTVTAAGPAPGGAVTFDATSVTFTPSASGTFAIPYTVSDGSLTATGTLTVLVPVLDSVTITRAEFRTRRNEWRIEGTTTVPGPGNTVFARLNNNLLQEIGSAAVDAVGNWSISVRNSQIVAVPGDTITVNSSNGGAATSDVFIRP
jgi:VCBS repeat-containing protein